MILRKYSKSDLSSVLDVWDKSVRLTNAKFDDATVKQYMPLIKDTYIPLTETWVVEVSGKVVGFISLAGSSVGGLFVHPDYHRRGIATLLLNQAKELNDILHLEVFASNTLGILFYRTSGFTHANNDWFDPLDEPVYLYSWHK